MYSDVMSTIGTDIVKYSRQFEEQSAKFDSLVNIFFFK